MGVRGLMSFIEDNRRRFYNRGNVHDCDLVIDGYGLLYHLYFGSSISLDARHGGEFSALAGIIRRFFTNLEECNIRPFVIFDGPIDSAKLPCILSRLEERVKDVHRTLQNKADKRSRMMPLFAVDVLYHYLSVHDISYSISLVDADNEIVSVANYLNCPVLSEDSDYYIYNVKSGYIPLQHFYWEKIWVDKSPYRKSIICHKYSITSMYDTYGIPIHILPYMSVLLGNDWIDRDTFAQLVARLPLPRSQQHQKRKKTKKSDEKMGAVLSWLESRNEAAILKKLENFLPAKDREIVMQKVKFCVDLYRNEFDVSKTLEILGILGPKYKMVLEDPALQIEHLVRSNHVHPVSLNIISSGYICMPVIMSDTRKPSPHSPASEIRTLLYRVLLRKYRFKTSGAEFLFLQEYDKVETTYKKSRTVSIFTSLCPMCEQHHDLTEPCKIIGEENREKVDFTTLELVFKILNEKSGLSFQNYAKKRDFNVLCNLNLSFLSYLDLIMVSTLLWMKRTSPKPDFIISLVVMIAWSISGKILRLPSATERSKSIRDVPTKSDFTQQSTGGRCDKSGHSSRQEFKLPQTRKKNVNEIEFLDCIQPLEIVTASGEKEAIQADFDVEFLHSATEWLCILNAVIMLHQVVELPSSKFAIQDFLTSSTFLHAVRRRICRFLEVNEIKEPHIKELERLISAQLQATHESTSEIGVMMRAFTEYLLL